MFGEATVSFSALLPNAPETKAMGDEPSKDIETLHLVIFDENGMLVETRKADFVGSSATHSTDNSTDHYYERQFKVTLSITDQPRKIHFIANCPVDQITYGHEASIIGNLYVTKSDSNLENKTKHETAYWASASVPNLMIKTDDEGNSTFISQATQNAFTCVPMLRNFAHIIVRSTAENFTFEGFYVYNTIDMGTVAPYNNKIQGFQSFINSTTGTKYSYPQLMDLEDNGRSVSYEGHALAAAKLNRTLSDIVELDETKDGQVSLPFYMYERRISVNGSDESLWHESPPHLIIKGRYGDEASSYYKVDLVYQTKTVDNIETKEYYHILRNFRYQFTIDKVQKSGYPSIDAAIEGAPNNILSGSTTTSEFTNISDQKGRLWVSYTTQTLVEGGDITFMYKYVPDITTDADAVNNKIDPDQKYGESGGVIVLEDMLGNVITDYKVAEKNITGGEWDGFREVTLTVKDPTAATQNQSIIVRTKDNSDLYREVKFYLKKKLNLIVDCPEMVKAAIDENVKIDIIIPDDSEITADMFPMDLAIETWNMSVSPNTQLNDFALPVVTGPSTIAEKKGLQSYYFLYTIETYDDYKDNVVEGVGMTISTNWKTSVVDNKTFVVVTNKYFNYAYDSWVNTAGQTMDNPFAYFKNLKFSKIPEAANGDVIFTFAYDESVTDNKETATITFVGAMADPANDSRLTLKSSDPATGTYTYTFTPAPGTDGTIAIVQQISLKTVAARGDVSVSMQSASYKQTTLTDKSRPYYKFDGSFSQTEPLNPAAQTPVSYSFYVNYPVEEITITMDGLDLIQETVAMDLATRASEPTITGSNGVYKYYPNGTTGKVTLSLQTTNTTAITGTKTHSITLSDGGEYYLDETNTIQQVGKVTKTGTLTFDSKDKRVSRTNEEQVWLYDSITFTNDKASATQNVEDNVKPVRLRASLSVTVSVPSGGVITKIVFDCNANDYATALKNSIDTTVTVTVSQDKVTVTPKGTSNEFKIIKLTGEVRLDGITVTYDI